MAKGINVDAFQKEISDIMQNFEKDVKEATNKATKKTAQDLAKELRAVSPKRSGKYAAGWTSKKTGSNSVGSDEYTVYNAKKPGVAHLLEHGHAKVTPGGRVVGSTGARPHIAPAVDELGEKYIENLQKLVEGK